MITTVQQHLLKQQRNVSEATGKFTWLMHGITLATKMVESQIRKGGLGNALGAYGAVNVQGEQHCLGMAEGVAGLVSEEDANPITLDLDPEQGKYIVVFDPLDGSSNIDVNVNLGTIFSVMRRREEDDGDITASVLRPGVEQVAAGYVIYGPSTMLVYTAGDGVHCFTLDPTVGAYVLSSDMLRMPEQGPYYSTNDGNSDSWPQVYRDYLTMLRSGKLCGKSYSARYIGSLVADFHRTLLKGGVFLYPPTEKTPGGKLRLLYEANPLAMIAEQAGGMAIDGKGRILDLQPVSIHQRTPLVVGSRCEVEALERMIREAGA
jgi:fructose-1,6-bisphosphatase I